ncbi:hypothetical protein RB195_023513 [Necator americanus]|uniref:Uncharacterized protein n=1 Tax=Necator americanus TaxID=51031 RepID=A0ABR1EJP5_NECAM
MERFVRIGLWRNMDANRYYDVIKRTTADTEANKGDTHPVSFHSLQTRRRSTYLGDKRFGDRSLQRGTHRTSYNERRHEGLVEAVAYLRKKSLSSDYYRCSQGIDNHPC